MTGIKFDAAWVGGYAKLASSSAEALDEAARTMATDPLSDESFGQLGRTVKTTQTYSSAAGQLRDQLARAVEALNSAATGLGQVSAKYVDSDERTASTLAREPGRS